MTEKMKTVCVGRHLIDVPIQAELSLSQETVAGFDIDTVEESEAAFRARVTAREADISMRGNATDGSGGMVEARDLRTPGLIGRTFIYGLNRGYLMKGDQRVDDEFVSIEVHAHIEGISSTLTTKYADEAEANLAEALLERLRVRGEDEVPSLSGFCVWHAVFIDPLPPRQAELVTLHLGLPGHPDMGLAFSSTPGGRSAEGLLERVAAADAEASPDELLRVTTLRSGKRDINRIAGEEVLEGVREFNFTTGYDFMWESRGVKDDPLQPYLLLNMDTGTNPRPGGRPVDSSLHEDAVLALWDRVSSSIRLRPAGPPAEPAEPSEPPSPKLGAVASAGEICPHSGWWKCREGGPGVDVQGGAVQWIGKGERMPQALLLPRQTLWQKLRGLQSSIEPTKPTSWKLVDQRLRPRTPALLALAQAGAPVFASGGDAQTLGGGVVPLGISVRTADVCPASGWWRCEEMHALDGARWFSRGCTMPAATFQLPGGMFARNAGPQVIQRRSTWRLMRHAEAQHAALVGDGTQVVESEGLVYGRDSAYGFEDGHRIDYEWVSVESHAHVGNLSFTLSAKYADEDSARLAEALLANLHVRGADEIPSVPGVCISRGVFAEPLPKYKTEHVTFHLGLPGHPDMGFAFNVTPGGGNDPSLLARYAKIDAEADPEDLLRVTRLRSGERSINGIDGEEIVERVHELNFTTGYSLLWETHGHADDLLRPYLLLNMQTGTNPRPGGKPVESSLHEDALLDLWDRISSSVRLRPSALPPAPVST